MAHVYLISLPPLCTNIYIVWSLVEVNICISCLFPWQKIDMMLGYHKTNENHLQEHIKHVKSSSNSHSSSFFFSLSLSRLWSWDTSFFFISLRIHCMNVAKLKFSQPEHVSSIWKETQTIVHFRYRYFIYQPYLYISFLVICLL